MAIFLSYSRHNEKVVKALAQGLESARRQVWLDADLGGGDAWWDKILSNIRSCSVFVFALSDSSWQSKPCREELEYAIALNRPILPVRVGEIGNLRANPLAKLQIVHYRTDDAAAGFEVLSAVDTAARSAGPLPDPLPPEPSIPYAYLQALGRQIDTAELDPADQMAVVDQLRKALREEYEESVRRDILDMLRKLMAKPWTARQTEREIRSVLFANEEATEGDVGDTAENAGTTRATPAVGSAAGASGPPAGPPPAAQAPRVSEEPRRSAEPDGRAIFERRMAELRARQEAREVPERRPGEARGWTPPGAGSAGNDAAGDAAAPMWRGIGTSAPQPGSYRAEPPPPASFLQPTPPQSYPPHPHRGPAARPTPPPSHWPLSIVSLLMSLLVGGIAMYFSYQVGQRYTAHDYDGAAKASRAAKAWGVVGIVVGGLILLASLAQG